MKNEIELAIMALVKKAIDETDASHAINFSQAAVNVAIAYATMKGASYPYEASKIKGEHH